MRGGTQSPFLPLMFPEPKTAPQIRLFDRCLSAPHQTMQDSPDSASPAVYLLLWKVPPEPLLSAWVRGATHTRAAGPSPASVPRTLRSSQDRLTYSFNSACPIPRPDRCLLHESMNLNSLSMSRRRQRTVFVLLYLAYFAYKTSSRFML